MTNYYPPLDNTTNKWAKDFLKAKFITWFAKQVQNHLDNGTALEDIEIKFQLTTMKPLHAHWLIELYNELTSTREKDVVIGGWKKSGSWDAIKLGSKNIPSIDPFAEIDLMLSDEAIQSTQNQCLKIANMITQPKPKIKTCQILTNPTVMPLIFLESRFALKLSNPEKSNIFCAF